MRPPVKLSSIDQEHLQELYDAAGVARDELPYTEQFDQIWQGFQDRTFKNAEKEQVWQAILKHVRSSSHAPGELAATALTDEQLKQLKVVVTRNAKGGKVLPYSDEFEAARGEFNKLAGTQVPEREFWQAMMRAQGARRRPPPRKKAKAEKAEDGGDDDGE